MLTSGVSENIALNLDKVKHISGWQNNCGFNSLAIFIVDKLEKNQIPAWLLDSPAYQELLVCFQEYYRLARPPTWTEIKVLLLAYPAPTDRENILGPVLRIYLEHLIYQPKDDARAARSWNTIASGAYSNYLSQNLVLDNAQPLFKANQDHMIVTKILFDTEWEKIKLIAHSEEELNIAQYKHFINNELKKKEEKVAETPAILKDLINMKRRNNLLDKYLANVHNYWLSEGCQRYAMEAGDIAKSVMLSHENFTLMTQNLEISLKCHMPAGMYSANPGNLLELTVVNNGLHWEIVATGNTPAEIAAHNRFYEKNRRRGKLRPSRGGDNDLIAVYQDIIRDQMAHIFAKEPLDNDQVAEQDPDIETPTFDQMVDYLAELLQEGTITEEEQLKFVDAYLANPSSIETPKQPETARTAKPRARHF